VRFILLEFKAAAFPMKIHVIFNPRFDKNNIEGVMFKKTLLLIFILTTLLSVLSACGTGVLQEDSPAAGLEEGSDSQLLSEESAVPDLPTSEPTASAPDLPTPEPTASAAPSNWISEKDGMEMIYIPAGEFLMGWEGLDATTDIGPGPYPDFLEHTVYLDDYWIDKYEVTNEQYQGCVSEGFCKPCKQNNIPPQGTDYFTESAFADYPVVNVSWFMARDYCEWVGRRMLTEAEWEKAARGTDGRKYPWGNAKYLEDYANICDVNCPIAKKGDIANASFDDGFAGPAPVGSFPAGSSPYGVMDMAGNVWEWTSTASEPYPYDANDGREAQYDIPDGAKWPERILRGGPWNDGYAYQRSSFRYRAVGIYWNFNMGIRCAYSE